MNAAAIDDLDAKRIATLKAQAAIAGFELTALPDGSFMVSRWGMCRELAHAADVERFLARITPSNRAG